MAARRRQDPDVRRDRHSGERERPSEDGGNRRASGHQRETGADAEVEGMVAVRTGGGGTTTWWWWCWRRRRRPPVRRGGHLEVLAERVLASPSPLLRVYPKHQFPIQRNAWKPSIRRVVNSLLCVTLCTPGLRVRPRSRPSSATPRLRSASLFRARRARQGSTAVVQRKRSPLPTSEPPCRAATGPRAAARMWTTPSSASRPRSAATATTRRPTRS